MDMVDEDTKLRIALAVGINIHGHPYGVNYVFDVGENSPALLEIVELLYGLEEKYAMQFGKVRLGMAGPEKAASDFSSAIRVTRMATRNREMDESEDMRYVAKTAGKYLDSVLKHVSS